MDGVLYLHGHLKENTFASPLQRRQSSREGKGEVASGVSYDLEDCFAKTGARQVMPQKPEIAAHPVSNRTKQLVGWLLRSLSGWAVRKQSCILTRCHEIGFFVRCTNQAVLPNPPRTIPD